MNSGMRHCYFVLFLFCVSIFTQAESVSGCDQNVVIARNDQFELHSLGDLLHEIEQDKEKYILSYDTVTGECTRQKILAAAIVEVNPYYIVTVKDNNRTESDVIVCSPEQLFFSIMNDDWVSACTIKQGDLLLSYEGTVEVTNIVCINQPIQVHQIEVSKNHTFFVGKFLVIVHNNIALPISAAIGLSIPFDIGCYTGTIGSMFGPVGFFGGIAVGSIVSCIINRYLNSDDAASYDVSFDNESGLQESNIHLKDRAPGKPTAEDGFVPKKNWNGEKVESPNGKGWGWPDKNGNVWVPSGVNGHGGEHWDVQHAHDDGYTNVLPGGKIRGEK